MMVGAKVHATAVDRIPAELWVQMLQPVEMEPVALTRLGTVSRALYEACRQDPLWRLFSPPRARGHHGSLKDAFVDRANRRSIVGNDFVLADGPAPSSMPHRHLLIDVEGRDPDADARRAFALFRLDGACSVVREDPGIVARVVVHSPRQIQFAPSALLRDLPFVASLAAQQHQLPMFLPNATQDSPQFWRLACRQAPLLARRLPQTCAMEPAFWRHLAEGLRLEEVAQHAAEAGKLYVRLPAEAQWRVDPDVRGALMAGLLRNDRDRLRSVRGLEVNQALPDKTIASLQALAGAGQLRDLVAIDERVYSSFVANALRAETAPLPFSSLALDAGTFWTGLGAIHGRYARAGAAPPPLSTLAPQQLVYREQGADVVTNAFGQRRMLHRGFLAERRVYRPELGQQTFAGRVSEFFRQAEPALRLRLSAAVDLSEFRQGSEP
jgi:hypothetical protein